MVGIKSGENSNTAVDVLPLMLSPENRNAQASGWHSGGVHRIQSFSQDTSPGSMRIPGGYNTSGQSRAATRIITTDSVLTWVSVHLENGWGAANNSNGSPAVALTDDDRVIFRGEASGGLPNGRICILPEGFRPRHSKAYYTRSSGPSGFRVEPDGSVYVETVAYNTRAGFHQNMWIADH